MNNIFNVGVGDILIATAYARSIGTVFVITEMTDGSERFDAMVLFAYGGSVWRPGEYANISKGEYANISKQDTFEILV